jgi:hypothetical protein
LQYGAGVGPSVMEGPIRMFAEVVNNVRFIVLANFRLQRTRRLGLLSGRQNKVHYFAWGGHSRNAKYAGSAEVQRSSNQFW